MHQQRTDHAQRTEFESFGGNAGESRQYERFGSQARGEKCLRVGKPMLVAVNTRQDDEQPDREERLDGPHQSPREQPRAAEQGHLGAQRQQRCAPFQAASLDGRRHQGAEDRVLILRSQAQKHIVSERLRVQPGQTRE